MNLQSSYPTVLDQEAKVAFLRQPQAYPEKPARIETIETHMSWVFLTPQHAYKLKKPVRYDYLDFSTVAARKKNCEEELRLNQRLAPDVYLDVVPLAQATVSQHLKELKTVGLIKGEVEGVKSCYCIDPEGIRKLEKELMDLLADLKCGCEPGSC